MSELSSSRFSRLESGGIIRITEAIMKGAGPQGPVGPTGPPGEATHILNTLPNETAIKAQAGNAQTGDAYIAKDTGQLWVFYKEAREVILNDGTRFNIVSGFNNVGRIVGNPGYLQSVAASLSSTTPVIIPENGTTTRLPLSKVDYNDSEQILMEDGTVVTMPIVATPSRFPTETFSVANTFLTSYMFYIKVKVNTSAASKGRFNLYLGNQTGVIRSFSASVDGLYTVVEDVQLTAVIKTNSDAQWWVAASTSTGLKVVETSVFVARFGGGTGPQGPIGPQGNAAFMGAAVATVDQLPAKGLPGELRYVTSTGDVWSWNSLAASPGWTNGGHIQGAAGNASTGFSEFDDLTQQPSSETEPVAGGDVPVTPDQELPYPKGVHSPVVPYFIRKLAETIESKLVSRYSSSGTSSWATRRPIASRKNGEMVWVDRQGEKDGYAGAVMVWDTQLGGENIGYIPYVIVGTGTPPAVGTPTSYPDGSLWVQY